MKQAESLAEKIAAALLTPYGGPECHRLQIMLNDRASGQERNMGGMNKRCIIDTINNVIAEHESAK